MGTYFTDGKTTVSITLHEWDDATRQYAPDWSADFYDVGSLKPVGEIDTDPVYECDSIDAIIGQAMDAVAGVGDYDTPSPNLVVDVTPVASPSWRREQAMTMAPGTIDADDAIRGYRAMLVTTLIRALGAADAGNVHTVEASLARAHDITDRIIDADEAGM
jgi:NADPH-dependent glutamate synthase beta subunit-like oxidoreductase